jgi:hypothetical protein
MEDNPLVIYENIFRTHWLSGFNDADALFDRCLFILGENELSSGFTEQNLSDSVFYFDQIDKNNTDQLIQAKDLLCQYAVQNEAQSATIYRLVLTSDFLRDYEYAIELVLEHDYQIAEEHFNRGRYADAYSAFLDIERSYKNVAIMINRCISEGFESEVNRYRTTGRARALSNSMYDGCRDIEKYRLLDMAKGLSSIDSGGDKRTLIQTYWDLRELGNFEDAEDARNDEKFTIALLVGTYWSSWDYYISDEIYFQMNDNDNRETNYQLRASSVYARSYGPYYSIEGTIYRTGSDDNGWRNDLRFEFVDRNTLKVYAYRDGRTYTLYK